MPASPFSAFAQELLPQTPLRQTITSAWRRPEPECLAALLDLARLPDELAEKSCVLAKRMATKLRAQKTGAGREELAQGLIQEFSLSSREGVALMCMAEALLRIPDAATRNALIRDKVRDGNWLAHLGHSPSLFVNAATWGLLLTGKLMPAHSESSLACALANVIGKGSEPLIRKGVDMAMRLMGEQFVMGQTITEALDNARRFEEQGFSYSYDMLGEAAMTHDDAQRYFSAYESAIHAIGKLSAGKGIYQGPGISIKLSALHPRYCRAQYARVMDELYPKLLVLTVLARQYDLGLNIDAEEADRLEISLDLLERLCFEPALEGWNGIGFVIQAYQKRCPFVIDYLIDLARRSHRRLMIRLVKGAYWDSEIKRAQIDGLEGYPVYTRKAYTDVSYLACSRKLLAAPDALYPQFATHNAHTVASIYHMAGSNYQMGQYEFQCLHGMGETLYQQVVGNKTGSLKRPCRIYAPVGTHETLLAYLVRRLLENGANTSFVNRIKDEHISLDELIVDPVMQVEQWAKEEGGLGQPHPRIPLPEALYDTKRKNSQGLDLANEQALMQLSNVLNDRTTFWHATPQTDLDREEQLLRNPADHRDVVGTVQEATLADVECALARSSHALASWCALSPTARADILERAAQGLQHSMQPLAGLIVREAGKTFSNAISEVRESVDFLRYYAMLVRHSFSNDTHQPLGPVVCISPWNFPLAIFTGQISAALATGNTVLAKPAEQTPLIAAQAVRILHEAGVPQDVLQLLPGRGETVGTALVADPRTKAVMFTGSTEVARILQRELASRLDERGWPIPLIAETGGQNAMIVDSSALTEQVVADILTSAFDSAGQRCSALRVLCVQEDNADRVVTMLKGAMAELTIGNPSRLSVDVGPVIDTEAQLAIQRHIDAMHGKGHAIYQCAAHSGWEQGTYIVPTLIDLPDIRELKREVFGPVLHVVRYRHEEFDALLKAINDTGYGLTLGLHTRIDETIDKVINQAQVGNIYVNRNIVGAVVGVQPFGGEGLSGTGPKAGGPLYLHRLLRKKPVQAMQQVLALTAASSFAIPALPTAFVALQDWAIKKNPTLVSICQRLSVQPVAGTALVLPGPTGESNTYKLLPRHAVLCMASDECELLCQLALVLAAGSCAIWLKNNSTRELFNKLPSVVQKHIQLVEEGREREVREPDIYFDVVLCEEVPDRIRSLNLTMAQRSGPIVSVCPVSEARLEDGLSALLEHLLRERSISVNTAAAGGNTSLMTID